MQTGLTHTNEHDVWTHKLKNDFIHKNTAW